MQAGRKKLGNGCVELAYDEGAFYQECVTAVKRARENMPMLEPTLVLVSEDSFYRIVRETEYDFQAAGARLVFVSVLGVPMQMSPEIHDDKIVVSYYREPKIIDVEVSEPLDL